MIVTSVSSVLTNYSPKTTIYSFNTLHRFNPTLNLLLVYTDVLTDSYQQPLTGLLNAKSQAIHSAADALRQILNKLPVDTPESTDYQLPSTAGYVHVDQPASSASSDANQIEHQYSQFTIPSDPPPPFRPLISHQYLPAAHANTKSPSVSSITHTQIITTAYGAPITNFQKPLTLFDVEASSNAEKWSETPIGQGVSQAGLESAPLDMYHVLSLKNKEIHSPSISQVSSLENNDIPHAPSLTQELPHYTPLSGPQPLSTPHQYIVHHQGGHSAHSHEISANSLGPGYEIHKSIGYELRVPPQLHYVNRKSGTKVRRSGSTGRRPYGHRHPVGRYTNGV